MDLAAKLQLKPPARIEVINAPMPLDLPAGEGEAVLVFVETTAEVETAAGPAIEAARADRVAWIAYPKGGQLGTDLNRDRLAALAKEHGVQPVRQISIDDVWSALRLRPA